ncbi:MAG: hypothetical protein FWD25_10245 [Clostridia bacterium]|nr:hypothetical protein [Clostridia bacterium]
MRKVFAILLTAILALPAMALASETPQLSNENKDVIQALSYQGKFPAGTVVSLRVTGFYGIDLREIRNAINCRAGGDPLALSSRIGFSYGRFMYDGDWAWLDTQYANDYMVEFTTTLPCGEIGVTIYENRLGLRLKDVSLKMPIGRKDDFEDIAPPLAPSLISPALRPPFELPDPESEEYDAAEKALIQFLEGWRAGAIADMVPLTSHFWRQKANFLANGAEQTLYAQISGKKLNSYALEGGHVNSIYITNSLTLTVLCDLSIRDEQRLLRYNVLMLYEDGEWLVDPSSLMSGARIDVDTFWPDNN